MEEFLDNISKFKSSILPLIKTSLILQIIKGGWMSWGMRWTQW